ncbi:MAG TPA: Hpt domain-containing protein [Geobacteraceae bacterium]|nr:Hpt domain-containing protein [Geobacteraceae bacterium]
MAIDASVADSSQAGAIDWSVLDALKVLQKPNSPDLRLRLMTMYLKSSPPLMEGIRTAISNSDSQLLTTSAHTLKSTSLSLGAMKLGVICAQLEQIGRDDALQDAGELPRLAEEQHAAVMTAFRDALQKSAS